MASLNISKRVAQSNHNHWPDIRASGFCLSSCVAMNVQHPLGSCIGSDNLSF